MKKPSQTEMRKVLLESLIDPRKPGKMKVVLDAENPRYFVERAAEALRAATNEPEGSLGWHNHLMTAITLIGAARLYRRANLTESVEAGLKGRITKLAKKVLSGVQVVVPKELQEAVSKRAIELRDTEEGRQLQSGKDDHGG